MRCYQNCRDCPHRPVSEGELNPEYVKIIRKRLDAGSQLDTVVVSYRFDTITQSAAGGQASKGSSSEQQQGVSEV